MVPGWGWWVEGAPFPGRECWGQGAAHPPAFFHHRAGGWEGGRDVSEGEGRLLERPAWRGGPCKMSWNRKAGGGWGGWKPGRFPVHGAPATIQEGRAEGHGQGSHPRTGGKGWGGPAGQSCHCSNLCSGEQGKVPGPVSRGQQHLPAHGNPKPLRPNWPFREAMPGQWESPQAPGWLRVVALQSPETEGEGRALLGSWVQPLGPQACPFRHSGCLFSGWALELLGWHERKGLFFPQLAQESSLC